MRNPSKQRVLVVDDDRPTVMMLSLMLEYEGYAAETALTAACALRAIDKQVPSIVLVDLDLPGMDGIELVSEIRLRYGSTFPILVVTGLQRDDPRLPANLDCDAWLSKPFDPHELVETVRSAIAGKLTVP